VRLKPLGHLSDMIATGCSKWPQRAIASFSV
jgi:hypothetical protein